MSKTWEKNVALIGAAALVGTSAFVAAPALAFAPESIAECESVAENDLMMPDEAASMAHVKGAFSFDQDVVSSNESLRQVFAKAAAALCEGLPAYELANDGLILVSGPDGFLEMTVDDMAEDEGSSSYVMGCACSSNGAGGGAISNAEVSGVALESVARLIACLS